MNHTQLGMGNLAHQGSANTALTMVGADALRGVTARRLILWPTYVDKMLGEAC